MVIWKCVAFSQLICIKNNSNKTVKNPRLLFVPSLPCLQTSGTENIKCLANGSPYCFAGFIMHPASQEWQHPTVCGSTFYMELMAQHHPEENDGMRTSCTQWLHKQQELKVLAPKSFVSSYFIRDSGLNLVFNYTCQRSAQYLWE